MECPANVTAAEWGGGGLVVGGSTEKLFWMLEMKEVRGKRVVGQDLGASREAEGKPKRLLGARTLPSPGQEPVQHRRQFGVCYSEFPCNYYIYAQQSRTGSLIWLLLIQRVH